MPELNFDGLVGPTHNYAGLSPGNLASTSSRGRVSSPRAAALEGLDKMRAVRELGGEVCVLPPHPRPHFGFLRSLGFDGSENEILKKVAKRDRLLLNIASSASAMWTANAATVAPSSDTSDERVHIVPANLATLPHRFLEVDHTTAVLRAIFADPGHFCVHDPLPPGLAFTDEGAANHLRLATPGRSAVHVFGFGRAHFAPGPVPEGFPARQTQEASAAVARALHLDDDAVILAQQSPRGIDAGAFHTDVLACATEDTLVVHEAAFVNTDEVLGRIRERIPDLVQCTVDDALLPLEDATSAYPLNGQLLRRPDGQIALLAPLAAKENPRSRSCLARVTEMVPQLAEVRYVDLRQSMLGGGGPACLRLRVVLNDDEIAALGARVMLDDALEEELRTIVRERYRERLAPADLANPGFHHEQNEAIVAVYSALGLQQLLPT